MVNAIGRPSIRSSKLLPPVMSENSVPVVAPVNLENTETELVPVIPSDIPDISVIPETEVSPEAPISDIQENLSPVSVSESINR